MGAYRDARRALEAIADEAKREVTAEADRLDQSAYGYVIEAVERYAQAVHSATSEATALAVEGIEAVECVTRWEQRLAAAQARLSDAVGAAVALSGLGTTDTREQAQEAPGA